MKKKITIFVHGTLPPGAQTVPFIHTFFFCPQGLTAAKELDTELHLSKIAQLLSEKNPEEFSLENFYFFGWSGKLSFEERKEAADSLFITIMNLIKSSELEIRLITHSHGGNVALSLGHIFQTYQKNETLHRKFFTENFMISELIMLACPVQIETAQYLTLPLFKKVYALYSKKDLLQILDPQGIRTFLESLKHYGLEFTVSHLKELGPLFSERRFPEAENIKQLHVKHRHRELLHIEFLLPPFINALPSLLTSMNSSDYTNDETFILTNEQS